MTEFKSEMWKKKTYLAAVKLKDQLDLITVDSLVDNLGRDPALGGIGLPCPRTDIVVLRHWGGVSR